MIWFSYSSQFLLNERYSFVYINVSQQSDVKYVKFRSGSFLPGCWENLSSEQIIVCSNVLHLKTSSGSFFVSVNKCKYICIYGKIPLQMYINLGDILGLLLLVGRLNKSCQMLSTLVCLFVDSSLRIIGESMTVNCMWIKDKDSVADTEGINRKIVKNTGNFSSKTLAFKFYKIYANYTYKKVNLASSVTPNCLRYTENHSWDQALCIRIHCMYTQSNL